MLSSAWVNGQRQQLGPASQATTQHSYYTTRNRQSGNVNNSCQYRTVNMGAQPSQSANFTFRDGTNRPMSNWQTPVVYHQPTSFPQPTGGKSNHLNFWQNSINAKTGNPCLPFSNEFQAATQPHLYQSSAMNSSTQSPPGRMKGNTTHPQQDMSPYRNHAVNAKQSISTQDGKIVSDLQPYRIQKTVHKPFSAYTTTATSPLHEQAVCNSSLVSATAYNRKTVHKQNPGQNGAQGTFYSSLLRSYSEAACQSYRNNSNTANSLSGRLNYHVSSLNQKTQQYAPQLNPKHKTGGEATAADNSNSHTRQYEMNHFPSKVNDVPPLHSRQSFPKTAQTVRPEAEHIVITPPQQRSVAGVTTTDNGSENGNQADNAFSNRNLAGSSHDAPQLMDMLESISPQKKKAQSFVSNSHEVLEMLEILTSVKQRDSSIHSSPGCTGARAIAVVQPLSQESYQVGRKCSSSNTSNQLGECTTTDESVSNSDKLCISPDVAKNQKTAYLKEGFKNCTENANVTRWNDFLIKHSAASTDVTVVSSSSSSGPQSLLVKLLLSDDEDSQIPINMQAHQRVAASTQQSVTSELPVSQNSYKDINQTLTDLSLIPTTPWTKVMLIDLIQDEEKAQAELDDVTKCDSAAKLINIFWNGNIHLLAYKLKNDWYKHLITEVTEFCDKQVTSNSTVLSQVKHGFGKVLRNSYVLKDKEVYNEPPYKSLWLNVNQQVDDIDKEFGFPWSLRHRLNTYEIGSQPDLAGAVNNVPSQIVSEASNNYLLKPDLQSVGSGEENQASALVTTSNETSSPNKTDSADSSDPHYSFEIQVLPPGEAKVIFEQSQSSMRSNTDSQPEEVVNSSEQGEAHKMTTDTLKESKLENESVSPIEQVCCIARWMEIIGGPYLSKCQCKKEQSHTEYTDQMSVKEVTPTQKNELCSTMPDTKINSTTKEENQANVGENISSPIRVSSRPELCNELSQTVDLTEDNNKLHLYFDNDQKNISQISITDSQANNTIPSKNEDKEMESAESSPSRHSVGSTKEIKKALSSEVASHMSDDEEDSTSTDVTDSSLECQETKTQTTATSALQTMIKLSDKCGTLKRKLDTLRSNGKVFPYVNKSKKCKLSVDLRSQPVFRVVDYKKDLVEPPHGESPATNVRTVELVLFGSAPKEKCALIDSRKRAISSQKALSNAALLAPKVLSVNVSPLRRKDNVRSEGSSLKQRIHEEWRRSFPPTKSRRRSK